MRDSSTAEKESIANFKRIDCHSYGFVLIFNVIYLKRTKENKTARIRAKPSMFRLHFKVYGAVIALKKFNEIKQNEKKKFSKI